MHELTADQYPIVRPLLTTVDHLLSAFAVMEGTCPGQIWVDDPEAPRVALLSTPEGHVLAGERPEGAIADALRRLVTETIYARGREDGWWMFHLDYPDSTWDPVIADLVAVKYPVWRHPQYFVLKELRIDPRAGLPEGYEVRRVDAEFLEQESLANLPRIRGWGSESFGSIERFLERGFAFCIVHGTDIASWCVSDCVSGNRAEIGIHTAEAYRRRGLAARAAAAAVEHCLSHGLTHIGWHCASTNRASAATARAVGFEKVRDECSVAAWFNEFDSLLVNGNLALIEARYAEAAEHFARAFAQAEAGTGDAPASHLLRSRADECRWRYKATCAEALAGNRAAAEANLDRALEAGTDRWMGY